MCSLKVWPKSHVVLFCWFFGLIYMYHAWLGVIKCRCRVKVLPCLRVVFFYYTIDFPFSWTANCFSAEPWIDFLDKPSRRFCLIFAFFEQKVWKRTMLSKTKCHIWTHHTQIPLWVWLPFSFYYQRKFWHLKKHCTHIVSVMWHESFELVFLGSLFHWWNTAPLYRLHY